MSISEIGEYGLAAAGRVAHNNGSQYTVLNNKLFQQVSFESLPNNPKLQPTAPFSTVGKLIESLQGMGGQLSISNVALGTVFSPPITPISADAKMPGMFSGRGGK